MSLPDPPAHRPTPAASGVIASGPTAVDRPPARRPARGDRRGLGVAAAQTTLGGSWPAAVTGAGRFRGLLWLTMALSAFFGPLDLSADGSTMEVGLDPIVLCKLIVAGVAAALGTWGLITSPQVRQMMQSIPALILMAILGLVGIAGPTAISGASIPTTLINCFYLFFVATAMVGLGLRGIATAAWVGICGTLAGAWVLYLFFPSYGVFPELLDGGLVILRLSGMAHPNAVSRSLILGLLLTMYLWRTGDLPSWVALAIATAMMSACYLAYSRTALMAFFVAATVLWLDRLWNRYGVAAGVTAGVMGLAMVTALFATGNEDRLVESVLSKVAKSGDTEEITSGTGRAEIWAYAIELISQRPVIGHGFNAAPTLMENHSQSTHNAVLHAALSGGIAAGLLLALLLVWNMITSLGNRNRLVRSMMCFLLISCLMEETVLETFPGPCTLLWLVCCFFPTMGPAARRAAAGPIRGHAAPQLRTT